MVIPVARDKEKMVEIFTGFCYYCINKPTRVSVWVGEALGGVWDGFNNRAGEQKRE